MRLSKRTLKKTTLTYFRVISMKMKNVKDLNLKMLWFNDINNVDIKIVNDMKDLGLKVFWFKKILIRLKRLRMSRAKKKLIIKFEFESNDEERWLDSRFKIFLYCVLSSVFNIIMITLNNRKLNDSKFDDAITI